jgi:hypothetical protein
MKEVGSEPSYFASRQKPCLLGDYDVIGFDSSSILTFKMD